MSRGFPFLQSQSLDRVTSLWLVNPRLPAMSPNANAGHTDLSVEKIKGAAGG